MKFRVTATFDYDVPADEAETWYGTADPVAMALIDETNYRNDPGCFAEDLASHGYTVKVEPA